MIYLDHNATTPLDPAVLEEMMPFLTAEYGNPSSLCPGGKRAAAAIARARDQVAALLRCAPDEIVFTGGGTEADNAALRSALAVGLAATGRRHLVTTLVEHSAIRNLGRALEREGVEVSWGPVGTDGVPDVGWLADRLRPDTALLSVMLANNETGVLAPVAELAAIAAAKGVPVHTDAVQAVGRIPVYPAELGVGMLSLSAHKLYGPKGVGALYVSRRVRFRPLLIGGGQEDGRRAGTENVAGIVGFGKACELAAAWLESTPATGRETGPQSGPQPGPVPAAGPAALAALRDRFEAGLVAAIPGTAVNGGGGSRLPNTSNLSFAGVAGDTLLTLLARQGLCCSAGSACATGSPEPSHVLTAMGFDRGRAKSSLRFSLGRTTAAAEIDEALALVPRLAERVRAG